MDVPCDAGSSCAWWLRGRPTRPCRPRRSPRGPVPSSPIPPSRGVTSPRPGSGRGSPIPTAGSRRWTREARAPQRIPEKHWKPWARPPPPSPFTSPHPLVPDVPAVLSPGPGSCAGRFGTDVLHCPRCGGSRRVVAVVLSSSTARARLPSGRFSLDFERRKVFTLQIFLPLRRPATRDQDSQTLGAILCVARMLRCLVGAV